MLSKTNEHGVTSRQQIKTRSGIGTLRNVQQIHRGTSEKFLPENLLKFSVKLRVLRLFEPSMFKKFGTFSIFRDYFRQRDGREPFVRNSRKLTPTVGHTHQTDCFTRTTKLKCSIFTATTIVTDAAVCVLYTHSSTFFARIQECDDPQPQWIHVTGPRQPVAKR